MFDQMPRLTEKQIIEKCPGATGKPKTRERNIITSLNLDPGIQAHVLS